jgi:hypothetical protein
MASAAASRDHTNRYLALKYDASKTRSAASFPVAVVLLYFAAGKIKRTGILPQREPWLPIFAGG